MFTSYDIESEYVKKMILRVNPENADALRGNYNSYPHSCKRIAFVDNDTLISLDRHIYIIKWNIRTGTQLWKHKAGSNCYNIAVPLHRPEIFAYSDGNYRINICETNTGKFRHTFENELSENYSRLTDLVFQPNSNILASSYENGTIMFADVYDQKRTYPKRGINEITSLAWNPNGEIIAISNAKGKIELFNYHTGIRVKNINTAKFSSNVRYWSGVGSSFDLRNRVIAFQPSPGLVEYKYKLATGSYDGNIALWGITYRGKTKKLHNFSGHNQKIESLAWSPQGSILASTQAYDSTSIRLWSPYTGENFDILRSLGPVSISFSPNGKMIASVDSLGSVTTWEITN